MQILVSLKNRNTFTYKNDYSTQRMEMNTLVFREQLPGNDWITEKYVNEINSTKDANWCGIGNIWSCIF